MSFLPSAFLLGETIFGRNLKPWVNLSSHRRAPVTQTQLFAMQRAIGSRRVSQHQPSKNHAVTPISTPEKQIMSASSNALFSMFA